MRSPKRGQRLLFYRRAHEGLIRETARGPRKKMNSLREEEAVCVCVYTLGARSAVSANLVVVLTRREETSRVCVCDTLDLSRTARR